MKREILLERIEKLKAIMPWYVLEYYQSKLTVKAAKFSKSAEEAITAKGGSVEVI